MDATKAPVSHWKLIVRMVSLGWRYRTGCVKVLLLQTATFILSLTSLGLTGLAIDTIRAAVTHDPLPIQESFLSPILLEHRPVTVVLRIALLVLVLAGIHTLLRYWTALAASDLTQRIVVQLRTEVYDKLQRLSFHFFDSHDAGGIINRVTGDVQAVRMFVDGVLLKVVSVGLALTVYLTYMLMLQVPLTLACLATTPFLFASAVWFSRVVRPAYVKNSELVDNMIQTLSESVQGIHVVKGFTLEDHEIARFREATGNVLEQKHRIFWYVSLFQPAIGFLTQFNMMVLLGYGGYLVIHGQFPLGAGLFVFANLLQEVSAQISQITNITNSIQSSLTGAERVFEILDAPIEIRNPPEPQSLGRARGEIRFENVTFGYKADAPILKEVSFTARPGQRVAIVGATGAGKSTLLSLIPRFYDPQVGRILIDGVEVHALDLDNLRGNIGLVFQDNFLFSTTAWENIAFGHPEATSEQVERAAKLAAADEFLRDLPDGYHTVLGEHGVNLSGGQRQRLAIARALLLDPAILILDDATASVDPETEHEIQAATTAALENRTTFVVAHRLSSLCDADLILVLEQGRIVQTGTHDELAHTSGPYRQMLRAQIVDDFTNQEPHGDRDEPADSSDRKAALR